MMAESISSQWKKLQKNIYNAVYEQSEPKLHAQLVVMIKHIISQIDIYGKGVAGMTGNAAAGIAIGLYRDGKLISYACTSDELGEPIQEILIRNERFYKGWSRWDFTVQEKTEHGGPFNERYYANRKAVDFLKTLYPRTQGYCYVVVSGAPYSAFIEENGGNLISNFYAELKNMGKAKPNLRFYNLR